MDSMVKIIGRGMHTGQSHQLILSTAQIAQLSITPRALAYDGDPSKFKLAIEASRLAYEYDPYFSLSIARVDPLPHQLEAVYEYFMRLPRIRFLLADDPGAGKTTCSKYLPISGHSRPSGKRPRAAEQQPIGRKLRAI